MNTLYAEIEKHNLRLVQAPKCKLYTSIFSTIQLYMNLPKTIFKTSLAYYVPAIVWNQTLMKA